jgi:hypothetical protein
MAARRAARRKTAGRGKKGKTRAQLLRILDKAQDEVEQLLKSADKGTLTGRDLRTGLREIGKSLDAMEPFERWDKR